MAPLSFTGAVGLEPTTGRLTVACSAIELHPIGSCHMTTDVIFRVIVLRFPYETTRLTVERMGFSGFAAKLPQYSALGP